MRFGLFLVVLTFGVAELIPAFASALAPVLFGVSVQ